MTDEKHGEIQHSDQFVEGLIEDLIEDLVEDHIENLIKDVDDQKEIEDDKDTSLTNIKPTQGPARRRRSFLGRLIYRSPSPVEDGGRSPNSAKRSMNKAPDNKTSDSPEPWLPPLPQLQLKGYRSTTKHRVLDEELANNIRNLLPARLQLYDDWEMVYSMEQHGISLKTLYRNCDPEFQIQQHRKNKPLTGFADSIVSNMVVGGSAPDNYRPKRLPGYVMVIKDKSNTKFGCFLNEHPRPMDSKRYSGNGECFLWKCEKYWPHDLNADRQSDSKSNKQFDPKTDKQSDSSDTTDKQTDSSVSKKKKQVRFKAFMYTGINPNIMYSNHNFISVGSSNGQNGLWIDKSLYKGVSYRCETFGNEVLSTSGPQDKMGRFDIMGLELWRIGPME